MTAVRWILSARYRRWRAAMSRRRRRAEWWAHRRAFAEYEALERAYIDAPTYREGRIIMGNLMTLRLMLLNRGLYVFPNPGPMP